MSAPRRVAVKVTKGTIESCPCPHCHQVNDFSDSREVVEKGNSFLCDHCSRKMVLTDVRRITHVFARAV